MASGGGTFPYVCHNAPSLTCSCVDCCSCACIIGAMEGAVASMEFQMMCYTGLKYSPGEGKHPPPPPPPPPNTHTHSCTFAFLIDGMVFGHGTGHLLMDSLLSLLIWNVLDFVDFKLVQEDLSSNRGAGRGWCLWPTFGLGTIHPWHPGSTNQPT